MYLCFVGRVEKTKGRSGRKKSARHRQGIQLSSGSLFASRVAKTSGVNVVAVDAVVVDVVDLGNVDI